MSLKSENLFQKHWVGEDSPLACQAFLSGAESAVQEISAYLADQPATYETADSEYGWTEKLLSLLDSTSERNQQGF